MEINVVKMSDVEVLKSVRKERISKYDVVRQQLLSIEDGECVIVGTSENQTPEALKQNIYQSLKKKFEGKKLNIRILKDQSGIAIYVK